MTSQTAGPSADDIARQRGRDLPRFRTFKTAALIDRHRFRRPSEPWVLREASFVDLEDVLALAPELRLDRPLDTTLHVHFAADAAAIGEAGYAEPESIVRRLGTGAPFRETVFHAPDAETAERIAALGGVAPLLPGPAKDSERATIRCARFGPIALHISACWGAVGSHRVHAAQIRHLIDRGYYVFRLFVDHHPREPWNEHAHNRELLRESLAAAFGHSYGLAIRDTSDAGADYLKSLSALPDTSPVERQLRAIAAANVLDPNAVSWAGTRAAVAVVNHVMHVGLAERITRAPIILETHDIHSELLDAHGIPHYVPPGPDSRDRRHCEEQAVWRRVAACVNISPDDHAVVARHAKLAELVRPLPAPNPKPARRWADFAAANRFPRALIAAGRIDVLLWGSYHDGNVAAVTHFIDAVVPSDPSLRSATIALAGRMTEALPDRLFGSARIFRLGHVDRIEDLFAHAEVLVIPDRVGTGLSIKQMDALAAARPFAATAKALRGLDLGDGRYRGAADDAELAADIGMLLRDPAARAARAALGAELCARNFSAAAHRQGWDRILAAVPRAAPRGPAEVAYFSGLAVPAGQPPPDPKLSVLLCTYERHDLLDQCLMSLFDQTAPEHSYEIVVVDNSADQAAAARNAQRFAGTRVRYLLEPIVGLSNARNVAIRAARAPLVAFIDDDAVATRNWIDALIETFDSFPNASAVGGRLLPFWAYERPAWMHDGLLGFLSRVDWHGTTRPLRDREWLACGNLAFRRDALLDVGAFATDLGRKGSDRILLSNEENELIARLNARGKTILYAPDVCAEHWIQPSRTTPSWIRRRIAWQAVSDYFSNQPVASDPAASFAQMLGDFYRDYPDARPGVFKETSDPERFLREAHTAYNAVMVMLMGGAEGPARGDKIEKGGPAASGSWLRQIRARWPLPRTGGRRRND
ncbi:MAG: glycosyltransferase [Rhodospirillaceae bacterium]|nr:glycosyltransferase [Rhodospirillaceae bacterium]